MMTGSDCPDSPYEYESERPSSLAVVAALADLEEVDPTGLDYTLYDYIQPKTLDTLIQSGNVTVTFTIEEYTIHITKSGTVQITC